MLAAMPQAPGEVCTRSARRSAVTERRNYVLREMWQNGYIDEATYLSEKEMPLQIGAERRLSEASAKACRRATISPTKSAASCPAPSARRSSSAAVCRSARRWTRTCRRSRPRALRTGLEKYDRGLGVWRGTEDGDRPGAAGHPRPHWRAALAETEVPRDIAGLVSRRWCWRSARSSARIGIESVEEDGDGHFIPAEDVTWARKRLADGKLGPKARVAGDLVSVGDVVLVRQMTNDEDGSFHALVAAAGAGSPGRLHGDGREHRPRDRDAGRVQLSVLGLQPHDAGAAPAGIELQALRLCRGARLGLLARDHRRRRADRGGHAAGPVEAEERLEQVSTARRRCAPGSSRAGT